jgi:protein SSD1
MKMQNNGMEWCFNSLQAERCRSHSVTSSQSNDTADHHKRRILFLPHLPHDEVIRQLHDRQLFRGILFVDERDCSDAYVICEDLDAHIYVYGSRNRNRALHGDVVAVRLVDVDLTLSEKQFKNSREDRNRFHRKLSTSGLSWTEIKEDNFENNAEKSPPKYSGVVVAILERVNNASLAG